ncbi:MAG: Rpn family recombination-promoting nuclease/putative transposase, partial [Treponema sp.]
RMKLKSDITTISETQFSAGVERGKSLGLAEGKSLGLAEGKSLGLAEGSRQKAFETARNLLVIGLSIDNIAKATGLTVQEVETLN